MKVRGKAIKIEKTIFVGNLAEVKVGKLGNKYCVIKRYYKSNSKEFEREKVILKELNHDGLLNPCYLGKSKLIVSYDYGVPLSAILKSGYAEIDSFDIINQLIDSLAYLHNKKIVHFDLKPANIIIVDKKPKIIDFGSSKYEDEEILTFDCTNSYSSLEYLLGLNKAYLFKDIWSLGCIIYEILYGHPLICEMNSFKVIKEILNIFGTPEKDSFKNLELKHLECFNIFEFKGEKRKDVFKDQKDNIISLLTDIFNLNPNKRLKIQELKERMMLLD